MRRAGTITVPAISLLFFVASYRKAFTASGKTTPVHVLLAYSGLFQSRDECDL